MHHDTPEEFIERLSSSGHRRAAFLLNPETGRLESQNPELSPIAEALSAQERDFARHEAVFLEVGRDTRALLGAFLHKTARGQGAGGVRHWPYETLGAFLTDGLRLSRGMGRKNALAGLWWGGGKGVIAGNPNLGDDETYRRALYRDYGRFITGLRGAYVTAEDVGTRAEDMRSIYEATRFVTCVPQDVGGSGNPSSATAQGVVCAMEAALEFLDRGSLAGKTIAIQGTGNVASFLIERLLERRVARIVASEISEARANIARQRFAGAPVEIRHVSQEDTSIFEGPCDVFAPSALGGILHAATIERLKTPIVCGAANNQLLDDRRDDKLLAARDILHVPDFVANRMGIVQCANEQYGSFEHDPAILRHFDPEYENSIQRITHQVLARARETDGTPTQAANELADRASEQNHPLWPGRTQHIIASLVRDRWHEALPE